ncbi:MAG TPA: hypothetical protein VF348_02420, partial [Usitatibacter sp.]
MRTHGPRRSISDFQYTTLVAALAAALAPQAVTAATYTVTTNTDNLASPPAGSLRQAILQANAACTGGDLINFNGPFVLSISDALPIITCGGLTIDGGGHQSDV